METDPTLAGAGGGVEVVLMGTAVILAFPKHQHLCRVTAGRTDSAHVT